MPANLPPQYFEVEKRFREARTPADKIAALEEMLAIMPHHKGTDKLRADLRRRLSKLKAEQERKKGATRESLYTVKREGAGQIVLVGTPNAGKSQLLASLSNAEPDIADYPFTTVRPQAGMVYFENVQIQLVDLPPLAEEHHEPWVFNVMQASDALAIVVDLSHNPLSELDLIVRLLEQRKIVPVGVNAQDVAPGLLSKRSLIVGNKADRDDAEENFSVLRELYGDQLPMTMVSAKASRNLDTLRRQLFELLGVFRVYSKRPGHESDLSSPIILKQGSTVLDLAKEIHKDFVNKLRYARIWGSGKFDGQRVQRDYILQDGDIIELHM